MAQTGTATLDFGAGGNTQASVVITGQAGILSGSNVEAFWMMDSTVDNSDYQHMMAATVADADPICGTIVPGTGFTIKVISKVTLFKTWQVRWVWA